MLPFQRKSQHGDLDERARLVYFVIFTIGTSVEELALSNGMLVPIFQVIPSRIGSHFIQNNGLIAKLNSSLELTSPLL
jgi:hypothetical protein